MTKYLDFIFNSIMVDINGFNHWYMWLIVPAICYTILLILKYLILTIPIWVPFVMIGNAFKKDN